MTGSIFIDGVSNGGLFSYVTVTTPTLISTYNPSLCAVIALSPSGGTLQVYRPNVPLNSFTHFLPGSGYIVLAHQPFTLKYLNPSRKISDLARLHDVCIDADGSHIMGLGIAETVYTTNSGLDWNVGGSPNNSQDFCNLEINGGGTVSLVSGPYSLLEKTDGVDVFKVWQKINLPEPYAASFNWPYATLDDSGTKFTVSAKLTSDSTQKIYISNDSGNTWTKTTMESYNAVDSTVSRKWLATDSSGNIILSVSGTQILMSSNRGSSYNILSPTSGVFWAEVRISSNGQEKIVAGFQGTSNPSSSQGLTLFKTSWNNTWSPIPTPEPIFAFDCDASGTKIAAASRTQIWVSDDQGQTWIKVGPLLNNKQENILRAIITPAVKVSKNGKCIATIITFKAPDGSFSGSSQIAVSKDFGSTWNFYPPKATYNSYRDFRVAYDNEFFAAYSLDDFLCSFYGQKWDIVNTPTRLEFNPTVSAVPINLDNNFAISDFQVSEGLGSTRYILVMPHSGGSPTTVYTPGYYNEIDKTVTWLSGGVVDNGNYNLQKFIMSPAGDNVIGVNYAGEILKGTTTSILPFEKYSWDNKGLLPRYTLSINTYCIDGIYNISNEVQDIYIGGYPSTATNEGAIYVSNDFGNNWAEISSTRFKSWHTITMNSNLSGGYTILAAAKNDKRMYRAYTPSTTGVVPNVFVPVGPDSIASLFRWKKIDTNWALTEVYSVDGVPTQKLFFSWDNFETWEERPLPYNKVYYNANIFAQRNSGGSCYLVMPGKIYKTVTTNNGWEEFPG